MILLFIAQKLTLCQSRIRVRSIQIFNKTIAGWIFYNLKSKIYSVREYFDDDISTNNWKTALQVFLLNQNLDEGINLSSTFWIQIFSDGLVLFETADAAGYDTLNSGNF